MVGAGDLPILVCVPVWYCRYGIGWFNGWIDFLRYISSFSWLFVHSYEGARSGNKHMPKSDNLIRKIKFEWIYFGRFSSNGKPNCYFRCKSENVLITSVVADLKLGKRRIKVWSSVLRRLQFIDMSPASNPEGTLYRFPIFRRRSALATKK